MTEFDSIRAVAEKIKDTLDLNADKKKISLLYAFNSTGKTRLSTEFRALAEGKVLYYNAFVEDLFTWDNEKYILAVKPDEWIVKLINDLGLEKDIINNFRRITNSKIEPLFYLKNGEISFILTLEGETNTSAIKISRGEESMFVWSIFYTILVTVIDTLNTKEEERITKEFNKYEYIIIDDPVSSIDDNKLINMAIKLIETIDLSKNNKLKFFITTHHALFYNVIFNHLKRNNGVYKKKAYILSRQDTKFKLEEHKDDSPFGYHLLIKNEIQNAINTNTVKKYHFNLFRNLLEKTANYLGYSNWTDCILSDNKNECIKLLNLNSHSKLSELEYRELSAEDIDLFQKTYNEFIKEFKWKEE